MKQLYTLFLALLISATSFGQLLLHEDFNYSTPGNIGGATSTSSDAVGSNNWLTHSNSIGVSGTIDVLAGNLTYSGLTASNGNKVYIPGNNTSTPRDINRVFTTSTSATTIYYSFLINVIDNTQLTAAPITGTNNYFMSLGATAGTSVTSLPGRVAITSSGTGYRLHISNTSTGTLTYTENPVDLVFGTTNLVVVKFDRSASPTVATLWVNPSSLGGTEPTSTLTNNSGTATVTAFASITIRNSSATPKAEIDEIRVGETWADVTPSATAGIGEDNIAGFKMYPNPVKGGKVFINSANTYAERTVEVFDVLGKQVVSQKGTQSSVDVSHLNKGIYIIKVAEEGKVATRKLVIE